jgi:hypothetical protein
LYAASDAMAAVDRRHVQWECPKFCVRDFCEGGFGV